MNRLKGQAALVTGSSSRIGAAVAKSLATEGAKVVVNYARSPKGAEAVVEEIKAKGGGRDRRSGRCQSRGSSAQPI